MRGFLPSSLFAGLAVLTIGTAAGLAAVPSGHVGAAMALLATLEDAGVLPPEGTPEANRVIKIVIQFQSAFMKSRDPAVRDYFRHALSGEFGDARAVQMEAAFHKTGWTSSVIEALDTYRNSASRSELAGLRPGFSEFNVTTNDFDYLLDLFRKAHLAYRERGQDIHRIFSERRQGMPGTQS